VLLLQCITLQHAATLCCDAMFMRFPSLLASSANMNMDNEYEL